MNKEQTAKASYHRPTFSIYGNLTELTRATGTGTPSDNPQQPQATMSAMI